MFENLVDTLHQEKVENDLLNIKKEVKKKYGITTNFRMSIFDVEKLCPSLEVSNKCIEVPHYHKPRTINLIGYLEELLTILFANRTKPIRVEMILDYKFNDITNKYNTIKIDKNFHTIIHKSGLHIFYHYPVASVHPPDYTSNTLKFTKLYNGMNGLKDKGYDSIMVNYNWLVVNNIVKKANQQPTGIKPKVNRRSK